MLDRLLIHRVKVLIRTRLLDSQSQSYAESFTNPDSTGWVQARIVEESPSKVEKDGSAWTNFPVTIYFNSDPGVATEDQVYFEVNGIARRYVVKGLTNPHNIGNHFRVYAERIERGDDSQS